MHGLRKTPSRSRYRLRFQFHGIAEREYVLDGGNYRAQICSTVRSDLE